jgi:hypothetical protein
LDFSIFNEQRQPDVKETPRHSNCKIKELQPYGDGFFLSFAGKLNEMFVTFSSMADA